MEAVTKAVTFLNENWTLILTVVAAAGGIVAKTANWLKKDKAEKKEAAIDAIRKTALSLVTEAERRYGSGTGAVKRAKVLEKIFEKYPVIAQVINKDDTAELLDKIIDEALVELRELLESNTEFYDLINNTLTIEGPFLTGVELEAISDE